MCEDCWIFLNNRCANVIQTKQIWHAFYCKSYNRKLLIHIMNHGTDNCHKMLDTAPVFEVLLLPLEKSFYNIDKIFFFSRDKAMKKTDAEQNKRLHFLLYQHITQLAASCEKKICLAVLLQDRAKPGKPSISNTDIHCISMRCEGSDIKHSSVQSLHILPPPLQFSCLMMELISVPRNPGFPRSFMSPALSRAAWRATDSLNGNRKFLAARKFLPTE